MIRDDLCRLTAGMLEGVVIVQSLNGKQPLYLPVPSVMLGTPASLTGTRHNDGECNTVLSRTVVSERGRYGIWG